LCICNGGAEYGNYQNKNEWFPHTSGVLTVTENPCKKLLFPFNMLFHPLITHAWPFEKVRRHSVF
jgi:hypothetical protein